MIRFWSGRLSVQSGRHICRRQSGPAILGRTQVKERKSKAWVNSSGPYLFLVAPGGPRRQGIPSLSNSGATRAAAQCRPGSRPAHAFEEFGDGRRYRGPVATPAGHFASLPTHREVVAAALRISALGAPHQQGPRLPCVPCCVSAFPRRRDYANQTFS